jgi:hypothetical protein
MVKIEIGNKENSKSLKDRFRLFFKHEFFKNKVVLWMAISNIILNLVNWLLLWRFIKPIDSSIILHYNVYFGVDMIGNWKAAFILPGIGLMLFFINYLLAFYFYMKLERIACHILLMASLMVQMSLLIASLSVILINY